jgi:RNA polymerase II subunit A small phosphatase-like protein
MNRLLVILDLDETLVHVPDRPLPRRPDFTVLGQAGYCRPHLDTFLGELRGRYDLALWTTARRDYAEEILSVIVPWRSELAFVWTREQCSLHLDEATGHRGSIKDMRQVRGAGFDLARVVMVDDSPEKHPESVANLIPIAPFSGDHPDAELPAVAAFIHSLAELTDVRAATRHFTARC